MLNLKPRLKTCVFTVLLAAPLAAQSAPPPPVPPAPTCRLTFTVTESDAGKKLGVQHFSLTLIPGNGFATLKLGSKVPVTTGSYSGGTNPVQTQFTYLDVGLNIRARLDAPLAKGTLSLSSQVEQSSVADSVALNSNTVHEPVIRQAVLDTSAELAPGKSVLLGALDTPGSTRHLDIEVLLELAK